ncbi:uncharacterized protein VTP21DRAFT_10010 [Calcarisporiella thermophila]|uniref:uncharacterized protein n=1 Tax=Calcarisporiella thermophila TaxID=911321 RepID=UPI0037420398
MFNSRRREHSTQRQLDYARHMAELQCSQSLPQPHHTAITLTSAHSSRSAEKESTANEREYPTGWEGVANKALRKIYKSDVYLQFKSQVLDKITIKADIIDTAIPRSVRGYLSVFWELERIEERTLARMRDVKSYPELLHTAFVRRGTDMSAEERAFLMHRIPKVREAFARYIGVPVEEVHEEDVPIVALAGSGGGYRAMIATGATVRAMKQTGAFDCLSYFAGVSGSTWTVMQFYSVAHCDPEMLCHLHREHLNLHPASPSTLFDVLASDTSATQMIFGGLRIKQEAQLPVRIVDLFGSIIASRLLLDNCKRIRPEHWRLSNQRRWVDNGSQPMPIYSAVRHERPWKNYAAESDPFDDRLSVENEATDAWYQWFEFSPYWVGNDELQVWVPTWGFGRHFVNGRSVNFLPEQDLGLMNAMWGGALAAPISMYLYQLQRGLPKGFLRNLMEKIVKEIPSNVSAIHPIQAPTNPNFFYKAVESPTNKSAYSTPKLKLMDAGFDNNLPLYSFVNPNRPVDLVIAVDSSSDVDQDFMVRYSEFARRKGIRWTKIHPVSSPSPPLPRRNKNVPLTAEEIVMLYGERYCEVYESQPTFQPGSHMPRVGEVPQATNKTRICYFALYPNAVDPAFDPCTADFAGFSNLVYTREQVDQMYRCAEANYRAGEAIVKEQLRQIWLQKREERLRRTQS